MPVYNYKGLTLAGDSKTGIIDADSPREARIKLEAEEKVRAEMAAEKQAAEEAAANAAVKGSGDGTTATTH